MSTPPTRSSASVPRSLATVAFLKARFDERADHLGMFMPLIADAVAAMRGQTFVASEIQNSLAERNGLTMPQHAVTTLIKRLERGGMVNREFGRFKATSQLKTAIDVPSEQARIEGAQRQLGGALRSHARSRGLEIESEERALELVIEFVEEQHVGLLLDGAPSIATDDGASSRELGIVAEFVIDAIKGGHGLASTIRDILEGLVLYRAAFLPDVARATRPFTNLRVFFDSGIVRQALGYEGTALKKLARETLDVLKAAGVQALVFDKTVFEIRRILAMYEHKLASLEGKRALRGDMARHFLSQGYTPSDVAQMNALLEIEISSAGFQVAPSPERMPQHTRDEKALAGWLADPAAHDEDSPRVTHDVDCVAGVLTIRRGHRAVRPEEARALFVSSSSLVVKNVGRWFAEQGESGVPPIVHIRALSNLAWLKCPTVVADFKLRELVALCRAALRPSRKTWERFLRHLEHLRQSNSISSDEAAAIVVSDLADRMLGEAELTDGDTGPDAEALDDVVARVKASYALDAQKMISAAEAERDAAIAAARASENVHNQKATSAVELARQLELRIEGQARGIARVLAGTARWIAALAVLVGAGAIVLSHERHGGWLGMASGAAVFIFVALEVLGIFHHLDALKLRLENWLARRVRRVLLPELGPEPVQPETAESTTVSSSG
jgi:hypothetical protein